MDTGQGFKVGNAFIVLPEVTRHLSKQTSVVSVIFSLLFYTQTLYYTILCVHYTILYYVYTILYYTMCTLYYYTIPSSRDLLVNRNMSLYGDLSALYLGVKNNNDDTPEFLTLCPCLNLWCFFSIFGHNILG